MSISLSNFNPTTRDFFIDPFSETEQTRIESSHERRNEKKNRGKLERETHQAATNAHVNRSISSGIKKPFTNLKQASN